LEAGVKFAPRDTMPESEDGQLAVLRAYATLDSYERKARSRVNRLQKQA
jgi:hypothetical protein